MAAAQSPRIKALAWGRIEVSGVGEGKDFKLYPGGGRLWDWSETGRSHEPGIQVADIEELLHHGATAIVLSRGFHNKLQVDAATIKYLEEKGVSVHISETRGAVVIYSNLVEMGIAVGGLFHSTC